MIKVYECNENGKMVVVNEEVNTAADLLFKRLNELEKEVIYWQTKYYAEKDANKLQILQLEEEIKLLRHNNKALQRALYKERKVEYYGDCPIVSAKRIYEAYLERHEGELPW